MKKTIAGAILSSILLMSSNGYAESTAPLNQDIQGTWVLEFTKRSEKSEEKFEREDTWTFNNGKVITVLYNIGIKIIGLVFHRIRPVFNCI